MKSQTTPTETTLVADPASADHVIDKMHSTALPPIEEPTYTKACESLLTQLGLEYNYDNPANPSQSCNASARGMTVLYGKERASDFVQVIYHGSSSGTVAYYQCVDPTIVRWPLGEYDYFVELTAPWPCPMPPRRPHCRCPREPHLFSGVQNMTCHAGIFML